MSLNHNTGSTSYFIENIRVVIFSDTVAGHRTTLSTELIVYLIIVSSDHNFGIKVKNMLMNFTMLVLRDIKEITKEASRVRWRYTRENYLGRI